MLKPSPLAWIPIALISPLLFCSTATAQLSFRAPNLSVPGNREAAVGRNACTIGSGSQLTAVLPESNAGISLQDHPTLFAYIPRNNAQYGELHIVEQHSGEEMLTAAVALPPSVAPGDFQYGPALVSISLDDIALEPGKSYRWTLSLVCDAADRTGDVAVSGVLLRADDDYLSGLELALQTALMTPSTGPDADQLPVYAAAGVWHDMLAQLVNLADRDPSYAAMLVDVLAAEGLEAIANASRMDVGLTLLP